MASRASDSTEGSIVVYTANFFLNSVSWTTILRTIYFPDNLYGTTCYCILTFFTVTTLSYLFARIFDLPVMRLFKGKF